VSEEIVLQENSEGQIEESSPTEGGEAPRPSGEPQEMPEAEANAREEEPTSAVEESPTATATEEAPPAESPAEEATEAATQEEPTAEASPEESAQPAEATAEPTAETTATPTAVETGEGEEKPKRRKKRRRRRRRPRAAALPPVEVKVIPRKKIIKPLKRGMELEGTVRRLAEFGAFIDIGVGTDGLVHISELSPTRVNKVSDVLQEGQTVKVWIKDLDREHNRISLTMIPPGTKTIRDLKEGEIVRGTVTRLVPYGAFVDIGIGREAMLHVREMAERYVARPEDVVQVGEELEARVISVDRRRQRVDLSLKGLRPEPEMEAEPEPIYEEEDEFPSVIALAFQKALGEDFQPRSRRERRPKRRRRRHEEYDEEMEEILSRTLHYQDIH